VGREFVVGVGLRGGLRCGVGLIVVGLVPVLGKWGSEARCEFAMGEDTYGHLGVLMEPT
jgi:hypothetical protein